MINLTNTTDTVQVVLAGNITASQLNCFASYRDTTTSSVTPGRNSANTNNTTAVNIVTAPSASTQRVVEYLSVYNTDTANATVTIRFNDNGTTYQLIVTTLSPGEKLEYEEGFGFACLDEFGALKNEAVYETTNYASSFSTTILANDVINSNAVSNTIADITGLSFSVTSGKNYYFKFVINYTSAAISTGARFSINGPAITFLNYYVQFPNAVTSVLTYTGNTTFDSPAAAGTATPIANAPQVAIVEGIFKPAANGTLIGRFASEVANSAITAKAGSIVYYKQLD
jgi:hypothetical protein